MARNRRNQSAEVRFGPALKALLICLFIGGAGVGYVCQKSQLNELGRQRKLREKQLDELRIRNVELSRQLAELLSPLNLDRRARDLNLGLGIPHPNQVIVLSNSAVPQRLVATPPDLAQRAAGADRKP